MKYYLADILTFSRFGLAIALIIMAIIGAPAHVVFITFAIGELTDALDGTCSTKWPFPKDKTPKYRKYASKYDIWADGLLAFGMMLYFVLRINPVVGIVITIVYNSIAAMLEMKIYGKIFGHPDDATPDSLVNTDFPLAKKIILIRRAVYLSLAALIAGWTLWASEWSVTTKTIITVIAGVAGIFFYFFLSQRRHNISRDAVKLEKRLEKKRLLRRRKKN